MEQPREIEFVFAPQEEGGYHVYAPDLPGLHSQGDTLEEATANAQEALELYVEGLREDGGSFDAGVIRRLPCPVAGTVWRRPALAFDDVGSNRRVARPLPKVPREPETRLVER